MGIGSRTREEAASRLASGPGSRAVNSRHARARTAPAAFPSRSGRGLLRANPPPRCGNSHQRILRSRTGDGEQYRKLIGTRNACGTDFFSRSAAAAVLWSRGPDLSARFTRGQQSRARYSGATDSVWHRFCRAAHQCPVRAHSGKDYTPNNREASFSGRLMRESAFRTTDPSILVMALDVQYLQTVYRT